MKKIIVISLALLMAVGGFAQNKSAESAQEPVTLAMPDTTNLEETFEYIKKMNPGQQQYENYQWLLSKLDASKPENWSLRARALCNTGELLSNIPEARQESMKCFDEALKLTNEMKKAGDPRGYLYGAACKINTLNIADKNDPGYPEERVRVDEAAIKDLDTFIKNPKADKKDIDEMAVPMRNIILMQATQDYYRTNHYGQSLDYGKRCLDIWNSLSDEEKNTLLYMRYYISSIMCRSAVSAELTDEFKQYAKEVETFLGNVSIGLEKGTLNVDDQSRDVLILLCQGMMECYSKMHDLKRVEELANLAIGFDKKMTTYTQYQFCKALIENGRYDDARKLYAEVTKDTDFMNKYMNDDDPVKRDLDAIAKNNGKKVADKQLSCVVSSSANAAAMNSRASLVIKNFNVNKMPALPENDGKVVLPTHQYKVWGVFLP